MVTTDEVEPALRRHVAAVAAGGAALLALLALLGLEAKLRSEPFGAAHTLARGVSGGAKGVLKG